MSCILLWITAFFILSVWSCKKSGDPDQGELNNRVVAEWERVSDSVLAVSDVPGMIIGIRAPGRDLAWVRGKGKANKATGEIPDPSMRFSVGYSLPST